MGLLERVYPFEALFVRRHGREMEQAKPRAIVSIVLDRPEWSTVGALWI